MENPKIAQKSPYRVQIEAEKTYFWCQCGQSEKQPFCDGSHKSTTIKPLMFKATEDQTVYLCGCKQTQTPPYCDGTHKTLIE